MNSNKRKNKRTCILILGMHRSGTSAISGCIGILGFGLGKQLIPPETHNEKGYFENVLINKFNDSLFDVLLAKWHDTLFLPQNWWKEEEVRVKKSELISILESEFAQTDNLVIKDPRISVLLPFYTELFKELNINIKAIISFRNPFEVANSLRKRDNLSMSKSLLLWMDAMLKAELHSRSFPRVFLNFDSLLENTVGTLQKINDLLKLDVVIDSNKEVLLKKFVERKLKHHQDIELPEVSNKYSLIIKLFKKLLELNLKSLSNTDKKEISLISKLFYSNFQFYNGIDSENRIILKTVIGDATVTYAEKFKSGENKIVFDTKNPNTVHEIVLYPARRRLALQINEVVLTTMLGDKISIKPTESNAEKVLDDGIMIFESEFPYIEFRLVDPQVITQISVAFRFLAMDAYTYRTSIKFRDMLEEKSRGAFTELQQENRRMQLDNKNAVETIAKRVKKTKKDLYLFLISEIAPKKGEVIATRNKEIPKKRL